MVVSIKKTKLKQLYEQDFSQWTETMAYLLTSGNFSELDIENLVEEVRDLSKWERDRLLSRLWLITHRLLKWDYQAKRCSLSWLGTIERERANIKLYLQDSPSLKRYLTDESLGNMYLTAKIDAFKETGLEFPETCPYRIDEVLNRAIYLN